MKVMVTGASGRLGSSICRELCQNDHEVVAVDRVYSRELPCDVHVVDLLDDVAIYPLLDGVDAVAHIANYPDVSRAPEHRLYLENTSMNFHVFHAANAVGVPRIVFASSIQVMHGNRRSDQIDQPSQLPYLPIDGETPANPDNLYGLSKLASEQLLEHFVTHRGLASGVSVRFPFVASREWVEQGYVPRPPREDRDRRRRRSGGYVDEAFAMILNDEVGRLVRHIIEADLSGYRVYLPASPATSIDMPLPAILDRYFPGVPLRRSLDEANCLVDNSRITEETGWVPEPLPQTVTADES